MPKRAGVSTMPKSGVQRQVRAIRRAAKEAARTGGLAPTAAALMAATPAMNTAPPM